MRHLTIRLLAAALVLALSSVSWAQSSEQVNTTATQTLTNKTLTAPTITGPTVTGTVAGAGTYETPVINSPTLNGSIAGSASWDSPGSIGTGTAAVGRFSTLTATTSLTLGTPTLRSGTGTPAGVVTAVVGSQFLRTDGGAGTTLYVKESGVGNTGWVAVSAGGAVTWTTPGTIGSATPNTGAFTTLSVTGQFSSSLSTGTAPFSVVSTTKVTNLNVDLLDGGDWAAPIAIGTTTPAAGSFTTLSATTSVAVGTPKIFSGTGSPEGVVTATIGSAYLRTDGSTGTTLYTKESGAGNTGWGTVSASSTNWGVPGTIGSTTPNSGVFTALTGSQMVVNGTTDAYSATIAIDAARSFHKTTATNSTSFTISNPTNAVTGGLLMVQVENTSGGILGVITWDTAYKMASFTKPATGFNRTVTFRYNGTNWIEINCSPEVPNG